MAFTVTVCTPRGEVLGEVVVDAEPRDVSAVSLVAEGREAGRAGLKIGTAAAKLVVEIRTPTTRYLDIEESERLLTRPEPEAVEEAKPKKKSGKK